MCAMVTREPALATASLVATCFVTWGCQCAHGVTVVQCRQQEGWSYQLLQLFRWAHCFPLAMPHNALQDLQRSNERALEGDAQPVIGASEGGQQVGQCWIVTDACLPKQSTHDALCRA